MMKKRDFLSEKEALLPKQENKKVGAATKIKSSKAFMLCTSILLTLIVMVSCFAFVGCDKTSTPPPSPPEPGPTVDDPIDDPVDKPIENNIPVEKIASLLNNLGVNYSYIFSNSSGSIRYLIANNAIKIIENEDRHGYYYYVEDGKSFNLNYNETDKKWHKTNAATFDTDSLIYSSLQTAIWNSYDEETQVFFGTMAGENIQLQISPDETLIVGQTKEYLIYDKGKTTITMPDMSKIVDDTAEIPGPVDPVEEEYIYEVDKQGNYVFNIPVITQTLETWLKGDNQWGKDFFAERRLSDKYQTSKVLYIKPTTDDLAFCVLITIDGSPYFGESHFDDSTLYNRIANQTIKTKEDFVSYLNSIDKKKVMARFADFAYEYSTLNYTTDQKEEFDIMTANVLKMVSENGVKPSSTNDPFQDKIGEFADIEILFGFKTPAGGESAGCDLGYRREWDQYYILEVNGNIEFVQFHIASSTTNHVKDEKENVLKDTEKWWFVSSVTREEINNGNKMLFED